MTLGNQPVYVSLEFTPNPNTLKYSVNRQLVARGSVNMTSLEAARAKSPLAERLFAVEGIAGVMVGKDFVTITKSEAGDWDAVHKNAARIIEEHLSEELPAVVEAGEAEGVATGHSEVEQKIVHFLENEIRPAVAQDGGDISFDRYEDGIVFVHMHGACSGCPSSTATLKMGIETRLRELVPEVKEVVPVS